MNKSRITYFSVLLLQVALQGSSPRMVDITSATGMGQQAISVLKFQDLNNDGYADMILIPNAKEPVQPLVFLHSGIVNDQGAPDYRQLQNTGLPGLISGDVLVFADLDNDGTKDAVVGRYLDIYKEDYSVRKDAPSRTAWLPGNGDGTFADPIDIKPAKLATTRAIAVGDVNEDGLPDLFIGNWYESYLDGYEGFANDLILQVHSPGQEPAFTRWPIPGETGFANYENDSGGRSTYGVSMPRLDDGLPMLLELNYGRRWNRLYQMRHRPPLYMPEGSEPSPSPLLRDERARAAHTVRQLQGMDIAPEAGVDGDSIRHGRHPRWPATQANEQPRSLRPDEPPFRSNGNTFDCAVGDIDCDGDFDLFLSTIIHAWAGESSDRSRFLVNQLEETGDLKFYTFSRLSVDRIPDLPAAGTALEPELIHYNQGDIYAELADFNNDGRLDLLLCSSDYPDPPPFDERLRIYFQQPDGRFLDVTADLGLDHVGAGMPSLADVDLDGDLDVLVGQSFHRLPGDQRRRAALISGALSPDDGPDVKPSIRARLFRNDTTENRASIMIDLIGDPGQKVTRDAYGTIVRLTADVDGNPETPDVVQSRQVLGPGGHSGKQHMLTVHFGLGEATKARSIEILWPNAEPLQLTDVPAGRYTLEQASNQLVASPQ